MGLAIRRRQLHPGRTRVTCTIIQFSSCLFLTSHDSKHNLLTDCKDKSDLDSPSLLSQLRRSAFARTPLSAPVSGKINYLSDHHQAAKRCPFHIRQYV